MNRAPSVRTALSRLFRRTRAEDGTATVEFVIVVPMVLMIFMASVEAGFYMAKHVMLERGVDMAIRDVRLGQVPVVNQEVLREMICEGAHILVDCEDVLLIEMRPVSTETFDLPAAPATCINRGEEVEPMTDVLPGGSGEFMIVRACAIQDPMFPSTGIGLRLRADAQGGYQMIASSLFVNEPR
jgi:hypothetical protein